MAAEVLDELDLPLATATRELESGFLSPAQARIVVGLPDMNQQLGAEFLASVGRIGRLRSDARPSAHAGLASVARDSGKDE